MSASSALQSIDGATIRFCSQGPLCGLRPQHLDRSSNSRNGPFMLVKSRLFGRIAAMRLTAGKSRFCGKTTYCWYRMWCRIRSARAFPIRLRAFAAVQERSWPSFEAALRWRIVWSSRYRGQLLLDSTSSSMGRLGRCVSTPGTWQRLCLRVYGSDQNSCGGTA